MKITCHRAEKRRPLEACPDVAEIIARRTPEFTIKSRGRNVLDTRTVSRRITSTLDAAAGPDYLIISDKRSGLRLRLRINNHR